MKKYLTLSTLLASALLFAGCSGNKYGAAYIVTEPSGAQVINSDDGTTIGVTPVKNIWQDSGDRKLVNLQIAREGYEPKATSFWLSLKHNTRGGAVNDPQYVDIKLFNLDGSNSPTSSGSNTSNSYENNGETINALPQN